jgi:predicted PurR-regulated permease PerM
VPISSLPPSALRPFLLLASVAIVLYLLYWLQPVLIPLALAVLLTFVLSPIVTFLHRHGLPRVAAVTAAVVVAFSLIGGVGWVVAREVNALVDSFPQYEHNLRNRIAELQGGEAGFFTKLERAMRKITRQIEETKPEPASPGEPAEPKEAAPTPVTVMPGPGTSGISEMWSTYAPLMAPLGGLALSLVLVIFMLIGREDLRDRLISLIGRGRLTVTTKALDEAGERISRYLLMQLAINGSYGATLAIGLYFIGLPYAVTWGILAAVLRYIPYLGAWLAALLPVGLSLLVSESWTAPLLIVGLFLALELVSNIIIEPWLYGRGVGVSETATLVMVAFWTWLWGPVGLVLATPLTVCLVLLGKYVPFLKFFDTLLGDQPALEPDVAYYQRLLARDQDEASEIAENHLEKTSLAQACDALLIPALVHAKRDRHDENLDADDQRFILEATREIFEELSTLQADADAKAARESAAPPTRAEPAAARFSILGCPARDETDEVGLLMLKELLDSERCQLTLTTTALLASEVLALVEEKRPGLLCIGALPPGGVAHVRLLCLRLRAQFPDLKILVGRWGLRGGAEKTRDQLIAAGADMVATSLEETRDQVATFVSILASREPRSAPKAGASVPDARVVAA